MCKIGERREKGEGEEKGKEKEKSLYLAPTPIAAIPTFCVMWGYLGITHLRTLKDMHSQQ